MQSQDAWFRPPLESLSGAGTPTHLIVSGFLRRSQTFAIYGRAMAALGIPGVYRPYELPRRDGEPDHDGLRALVDTFARSPMLQTLVVSDPYKLAVGALLDRLDASAERVGAVNLVVKEGGVTVGCNIDGEAFALGAAEERGLDFAGRRLFCFGCGGVSRAVALALAPHLAAVGLTDLDARRAEDLRRRLRTVAPSLDVAVLDRAEPLDLRAYDVLYNGTGLGKHGADPGALARTPLDPADHLPAAGLAVDANYTPPATRFLEALAARGFDTLNGYSHMFGFTALHLSRIAGRPIPYATVRALAGNG